MDGQTGETIEQIPVLPEELNWAELTALTWKPDESALALANRSGEIVTVAIRDHTFEYIRRPEEKRICTGLAWHPFKQKLAASLQYGVRELFDLTTGRVIAAKKRGLSYGGSVAWDPTGSFLTVHSWVCWDASPKRHQHIGAHGHATMGSLTHELAAPLIRW